MKYIKSDFTIVPNLSHLKGIDINAQIVFLWICKYADENGVCFPSISTLAENAGVSTNTIRNGLKILEEKELVYIVKRKVENDHNLTNLYQILVKGGTSQFEGGTSNGEVGGTSQFEGRTISNKNYTNLTISSDESENEISYQETDEDGNPLKPKKVKKVKTLVSYSFEEQMTKLRNSTWEPDKVIFLYWTFKKYSFDNFLQQKTQYNRDLKIAKYLVEAGYSFGFLGEGMKWCKKKYEDNWTLETLGNKAPEIKQSISS